MILPSPDQLPVAALLASGSSTDVLTIELDSNSFNLFETEPSIVIQPDLSTGTGNLNSRVSTRQICCSTDWTKLSSTMALGKPLVPSLRWAGISLYKSVCCLTFECRKFIFNKSSILGMGPVTTSTRTTLVFFVTLVMADLYNINLPMEILKKKSEAKVLYAGTCEKC
jgi:hypothetical protein